MRVIRYMLIAVVAATLITLGVLVAHANVGGQSSAWAPTCGSLRYAAGRLQTARGDASRAETCFANAVKACAPASLGLSVMGVDSGHDDTFISGPSGVGGSCQIQVSATFYVVPNRQTTTTAICASVARTPDGLTISGCGSLGDFNLPITAGYTGP